MKLISNHTMYHLPKNQRRHKIRHLVHEMEAGYESELNFVSTVVTNHETVCL